MNSWDDKNFVAAIEKTGRKKIVLAGLWTETCVAPEVEYVRKIVADGYVGEVLSATYIGAGLIWGNDVPRGDIDAMDSKNGATLLSVIGGHAISAVQSVLGRSDTVKKAFHRELGPTEAVQQPETTKRLFKLSKWTLAHCSTANRHLHLLNILHRIGKSSDYLGFEVEFCENHIRKSA